jgi:hypothetical protein
MEDDRFEEVDRMLADGRALGRVRVGANRGGVAIGFPRDPAIHVSWWVLGTLALLWSVRVARRRRRRS